MTYPRVDHPFGEVDRLEDGLQQVRHRRLGHRTERQRADGDPELRRRHHLRQPLQSVQDLSGPRGLQRFDLAAPHGDERELGTDEEAVGEHQQHGEKELEHAHRTASGAGVASAVLISRTRSAR